MQRLTGLGHVVMGTADASLARFENYIIYGLKVCRYKYYISKSVAYMTVRRICESVCIAGVASFAEESVPRDIQLNMEEHAEKEMLRKVGRGRTR